MRSCCARGRNDGGGIAGCGGAALDVNKIIERHDETMGKMKKRVTSLLLSAALLTGLSGCYSENNLWAAKMEEITLPMGGYIYYLSNGYAGAQGMVSSEEKVLKSTVEDEKAETWIKESAEDEVKKYFYLEKKFQELGLSIEEEDQEMVDSLTSMYWEGQGFSGFYEALGVSRDSFEAVFARQSMLNQKIFEALYGPEGEFGVSDKALGDYYEDEFFAYESFTASFNSTDEEGNTIIMDEDQKDALKEELEDYADQINDGDLTLQEAADDYQTVHDLESSTYSTPVAREDEAMSEAELAVLDMKDGDDAKVIVTMSGYAVVQRLPLDEHTDDMLASEEERLNILQSWKIEEYNDYVTAQSEALSGINMNDSAIKLFRLKKLAGADKENEMGTSQPPASSAPEENLVEASHADSGSEGSESEAEISSTEREDSEVPSSSEAAE